MSTLEYGYRFLKSKLKNNNFCIWSYDYYKNDIYLMYDSGHQKGAPPSFPKSPPGDSRYKIKRQHNKVTLYFYYEQGTQVAICIFHDSFPLTNEDVEHAYHLMRVFDLEQTIQLKTTEMKTMVDSIRSITSTLHLDQVLENIIRNALKVIPAADAGYLMLYDPDEKKLKSKAPVGFNDLIYQFNVKVGEAITGKVFEDGKGRIFNSRKELFDEMHTNNISAENLQYIIHSSKFTEGAICVPISIDEERIGVMIIHQWKIKRKLTEHDLNLLQGFAVQAAIAIQNARFHTETSQRLEEITALSSELTKKNSQLEQRQEVHETLMSISLRNKGMNLLVDELEKMIDRKVWLFNGLDNTFYSTDPSSIPYFSIFEVKTIFSKKRQAVHVKVVVQTENMFYLFPIYNGSVFLGCLIIQLNHSLSKSDRITLEQGSSVIALELVKKQTVTTIYNRKTYEKFQELLQCEDLSHLRKLGKESGLNPSSYWMICILEIPKYSVDTQYLDVAIYQLISGVNTEFPSTEKLAYGFYNKVILLISLPGPAELKRIHERLYVVREEWKNTDSQILRGGLSNVYDGLENIQKCYEEANKTLDYLNHRNRTEIIRYEDIGLNRLFLNQPTEEIEQFINETLSPLSPTNEKHKELEETLLIYMELNRSANKTADHLHIHINTLYQRLKKIEDLLNIDLRDSEDMLEIQLACHLKRSHMAVLRN
ncbi:helix-turn-helix domain-containing protein [Halobacillus shinanisalinarum]|uniref:Helix-turn-helix domain-containing protein n=1 Tax=Halobacillus shinanisalinarum TaxID=2932258 RepID=A0ABY4H4Z7_9BACI|nr:helix-turn-helix domain-containing protein [Halobacillus shinanisalinarum]UOQ94652.1 helix-turn-helix domain-containing protein [Halobacillus shinanisalinarum]